MCSIVVSTVPASSASTVGTRTSALEESVLVRVVSVSIIELSASSASGIEGERGIDGFVSLLAPNKLPNKDIFLSSVVAGAELEFNSLKLIGENISLLFLLCAALRSGLLANKFINESVC